MLALALLVGCTPDYAVQEEVQELQFTDAVTRVEIDVEYGNVELLGRIDDLIDTRVEVTSRWSQRTPNWDATLEDGVLKVISRCPAQRACSTDVRLRVPPAVDATVDTRAGDLVLGRMVGRLDAETRAGHIDLTEFSGERVELFSEAGMITGEAIEAPVVIARTDAGEIDLRLEGALQRVVGETDGGAVTLDVPTGGYRLDLDAEAGAITLEGVEHVNGADGLLHVQTDAGSIAVFGH